ncbi:MAG: hypothetical protein Q9198_011104, partial [Flavoplaca austrocitrina]
MELKDLSSNWKKLQASWQSEKPQSLKRNASDDVLKPQKNGTKRIKATAKPSTEASRKIDNAQNKNMGVVSSYVKPAKSSASLALWAEDNDIPAKDLAAAYRTS